jgi:hypothetical protein
MGALSSGGEKRQLGCKLRSLTMGGKAPVEVTERQTGAELASSFVGNTQTRRKSQNKKFSQIKFSRKQIVEDAAEHDKFQHNERF